MKLLYFFVFASLSLAVSAEYRIDELLRLMGVTNQDCVKKSKIKVDEYEKCQSAYDGLKQNITDKKTSVKGIIDGFCKHKTVLCGDILKKNAYTCFNGEQQRFLYFYNLAEHAGLEAGCKDDEKLIKNFYDMDYTSCPKNIKTEETICNNQKKSLGIVKPRDYYSKENCLKQFKLRDCYAGVYKYCKDNSAYKFITKTTKARFKATPCKASISELSSLLAIVLSFIQIQKLFL